MADQAVVAARDFRRHQLIAVLPRVVAKQDDAPGLRVEVPVPQGGERNPHLHDPAALGDPRRRIPEEIRRGVLSGRVVRDRVVLHVARVDEELERGAAGVQRVDEEPAEVHAVAVDRVVVAERGAKSRRTRIVELERCIEEAFVVGQVAGALHRRHAVVAGLDLVPRVDPGRRPPRLVGQIAVDVNGAGRPRDVIRGAGERRLPAGRRRPRRKRRYKETHMSRTHAQLSLTVAGFHDVSEGAEVP